MATATQRAKDSYMKLIDEFPLRRITSASDHSAAKQMVLRLSARKATRGAADYLDVLVDLIADYERRSEQAIDARNVGPAELVRHRLSERGMSVSALARLITVPQSNLSEMLSGKRAWSKTAIRGLSERLNIRADRFFV